METASAESYAILMVDDIPANLVALEAVLEPLGVPLLKATSGDQALSLLLRREVALVLLDVQMPGLDGFETARLIKSRPKWQHIPILFVTATNREEASIVKGYAHGAIDYIVKPYNTEVLRAKVELIIERRRLDERLRQEQRLLLTRAELARSEAESRLKMAMDAAGLGIWSWDLRSIELSMDDRTKAIHGLPPDARVTYDSFLGLIRAEDRSRVDQTLQDCLHPGVAGDYRLDYACIWPSDGSVHWVDARGQAFFSTDGSPARFIGTALDITERKRVEEASEQFIAILGHDLQNPLTAIEMCQRLVLSAEGLTETQAKAAARIGTASARMRRMIRELLDFARARISGAFPITRSRINFGTVAQLATDELTLAHPDRTVEFLDEGDLHGEWDSDRVAQVVSNLVSNALRHGQDPVRVEVRDQGPAILLQVSNQGAPIPAELLQRIFEPFRSGADADRRGLGLGLFIVRQIVRAHGGDVEASSSAGTGTVFRATFPRLARPDAGGGPALRVPADG